MATREKHGHVAAKSLVVDGGPVNPVVGGQAIVTGTLTITTPLKAVASAVACLTAIPSADAAWAAATAEGNTITISVWGSDGQPSKVPTPVNYIAVGE